MCITLAIDFIVPLSFKISIRECPNIYRPNENPHLEHIFPINLKSEAKHISQKNNRISSLNVVVLTIFPRFPQFQRT